MRTKLPALDWRALLTSDYAWLVAGILGLFIGLAMVSLALAFAGTGAVLILLAVLPVGPPQASG